MDSVNDLPPEHFALNSRQSPKWLNGVTVTMLAALLVLILLAVDFSAILFAESRRKEALELVTPVMRLTQAERTLNSAGYLTLYIDSSPPCLQVSTITDPPVTARLLHKVLPSSAADDWLRDRLAMGARFYINGNSQGQIATTTDGGIKYSLGPPASLPFSF